MKDSMENRNTIRFVRRCRLRILLGTAASLLGAAALAAARHTAQLPILYLEALTV